MRVLVTGGAGFIGHHLVIRLLSEGNAVNILDVADQNSSRVNSLIDRGATYFQGDITDIEALSSAMHQCTHVVHLAAQTSVQLSVENPENNDSVNINGTDNIIQIANIVNVQRIIFASSAAVYGDCEALPLVEESAGICLSPYAKSKLKCEQNLLTKSQCSVYALRLFNVYGPGQNSNSGYSAVIPAFVESLTKGLRVTIYGDGMQTRDFVHVHDVVRLINHILSSKEAIETGVYNVASQSELSVNQLHSLIIRKLNEINQNIPLSKPHYAESRKSDIRHSCADISKVSAAFGWHPEISIDNGLASLIKYHMELIR